MYSLIVRVEPRIGSWEEDQKVEIGEPLFLVIVPGTLASLLLIELIDEMFQSGMQCKREPRAISNIRLALESD